VAQEGAEAPGGPLLLQRPTSAEQIDDAAIGEQAASFLEGIASSMP
jgi:hypothetical protein